MHRRIGDMITAELDEITGVPGRRPTLVVRVSEAVRDFFTGFDRHGNSRSVSLIENKPAALDNAPLAAFAGAFGGCLVTLCLGAFGIAPGIASALATALLCGLLLVARTTRLVAGAFFTALYGGTFGGMTPILWLSENASSHWAASTAALSILLSIACGLAFYLVVRVDIRSAAPIGAGYGGRLGAVATVASFLFIELAAPMGADVDRFHSVGAGAFDVEPWSAILGFLACLVGIVGTLLVLRQRRVAAAGVAERIFIASAVALVGLTILHLDNADDGRMSDAFYAGCFLGMSTPDRLKGWFQAVLGALVLTVLLIPVRAFLPGFGGGLGFAAFVTVMLLVASRRATAWTTREMLTGNNGVGSAVANAMIAASLMVGPLAPWNAATPDGLAEEVPGSMGATASEPTAAGPSERALAQLVIGKSAPGVVDDPIPLGISLVNAAADDVVVLSGLPPGSSVTNGGPSAAGGWHLFARELADAAIRPAPGFVGGTDATVELRRADRTIDRQALHLEWTGRVPRATADAGAPPVIAGPSAGRPPVEVTEDHEALFRAFLEHTKHADGGTEDHEALFREFVEYTRHSTPEMRQQPRPAELGGRTPQPTRSGAAAKTAARDHRAAGQNGAVRPSQPIARRGDGQKGAAPKNSPPRPGQDRPTPVSASR
jgi:hypothetical protein